MEEFEILSEMVERGVFKPASKRQPVAIDWGVIEDGDSVVAHNAKRAAVLISSFKHHQKNSPKHQCFSISQRKQADGSVRLFFEDTDKTLREKLLKRGIILPKSK